MRTLSFNVDSDSLTNVLEFAPLVCDEIFGRLINVEGLELAPSKGGDGAGVEHKILFWKGQYSGTVFSQFSWCTSNFLLKPHSLGSNK